jgi:acyl-CoA thioesterase YciA
MDLITRHVCMTKDLGVHGNLFGGKILSWIDEAAAAYACMYCDTKRMVTLKVSELLFKKPIKQGQLVIIYGEVLKVGKTSLTLNIHVKTHDPSTAEEKLVTETEMIFVKIDENGDPTKIGQEIRDKFEKSNTLLIH